MSHGHDLFGAQWEQLSAEPPEAVSQRTRCVLAPDGSGFLVPFLGQTYLVAPPSRTVRDVSGRPTELREGGRVGLEVAMVLLAYLTTAKDVPPARKWISEQSLQWAAGADGGKASTALSAAGSRLAGAARRASAALFPPRAPIPTPSPTDDLARSFGDRPEGLIEVARALGARDVFGPADATIELNVFPRVPLRIQLWARDDEFDAHATILLDASVKDQLPPEAVGSLVGRLVKYLCCAV
jgi:hypothetical protein